MPRSLVLLILLPRVNSRAMPIDVSVGTRMLLMFPQTPLMTRHILLSPCLRAWLCVRMLLIILTIVPVLFIAMPHPERSLTLLVSWVGLRA